MPQKTHTVTSTAIGILIAIAICPGQLHAAGASVLQTAGSISAFGATYSGTCTTVQTPSDNILETCALKLASGSTVSKTSTFSYPSQDAFGRPVSCRAVITPSGNAEVQCRKSNTAIVFVASIRLSLSQSSVTDCFANMVNVNVAALDSSGNLISGPYLDSSGNPLTITLGLTDSSGSTSLSATSLLFPTPVTLSYNGQPASSATVSASAPGLTTQMVTLNINVSTAHNLYVADRRFLATPLNDAVAVFANAANGNVAPLGLPNAPRSELANPFGIAIDNACNMYVSNNANGTNIATGVSVFPVSANGATAPARMFTDGTNTTPIPWGLTLDPSGNVAVAYQNSGFAGSFDEIAFFSPASSGPVTPLFQLTGSSTGLAFPGPIAFDGSGELYVGNFLANDVTAYAAGAHGNAAPIHTLTGDLTNAINNPEAVAVDSSGNIYVANAGSLIELGVDSVTVYGPGANGYPTPIRTITGPLTQLSSPIGLVVDSSGNVYVLNGFIGTTSITVYAPGATGNVAPIRTIAGSLTGLGSSVPGSPMALDGSGNLYVLNLSSSIYGRSVLTFAAGANGNVAPIRAITDTTSTTINGNRSTALAVDFAGNVYAGSNNGLFSLPNVVMVFAAGSTGDAAPMKTITSTSLDDVEAMGVDSSGNIYALVDLSPSQAPDAVLIFAPSASGTSTPIRTVTAAYYGVFQGSTMAVDSAGDVLMTGLNGTGALRNAVSVYPASINGSATPSRVIRGGAQGVFDSAGLGFDGAGNLYILNIGDQTVKIYAPGADGLAVPLRSIQGISFIPSGLLVDTDGTVYVSTTNEVSPETSTSGMILVYAPGASGLAAPIRTIAGSATQLILPRQMTFGP